ncbi:hypothetical protein FQR65_LT11652 [Abscondita terminalis]|nr:hypothetical protein FQR65_LT11652 [Abscondita terminalis]
MDEKDYDDMDADQSTENLEDIESIDDSDNTITEVSVDRSSPSVTVTDHENEPESSNTIKNVKKEKRKRAAQKQSSPLENPVVDFFSNLGKTVSTFPTYWQACVKSKVLKIVNSTEIMLLSQREHTSPSPAYSQFTDPMFSHIPATSEYFRYQNPITRIPASQYNTPQYTTSQYTSSQYTTSHHPLSQYHTSQNPSQFRLSQHPAHQYFTSQESLHSPSLSSCSSSSTTQPIVCESESANTSKRSRTNDENELKCE